ncbi:MAG: N-acetyl sugar amidotransferase [Cyclobacteriaceae bacterium]|jgi:N-acetyl sugar amidotransferase|nr:N-acetyl sugar amidotransferase [Flammeovirgaceae bacterium]
MNRTIVVFTIEYPDPLLDKELPYLAANFDKVYLLPQNLVGSPILPANVEAYSIFKRVDLKRPLSLIVKHVVRIVRIYGSKLTQSEYRRYYIKYVKSFLGYLVLELEKISPIRNFIQKHQLENALFYDYWLVDSTLALAELKREGLIKYSIARTHGFDLYHERQFEKHVAFQEFRIAHLDKVFTISRHGFNYLHDKLPKQLHSKVGLNYLGVTPKIIELLSKREADVYTIVSCSSVIGLKRVGLLAEVLKRCQIPIRWIHFGDGPLMSDVKQRVSELPSHIQAELRGNQPNQVVMDFYREQYVDLFVSFSQYEGLPVSMMEAIQFGIPVMACEIYGIPEIVTPQTGVLVNVNDEADALALMLQQTLKTQPFDRKVIREFFENRFNAERNFEQFIGDISALFPMQRALSEPSKTFQQCTRCVLDTSDDPAISFNGQGVCSYCQHYDVEEKALLKSAEVMQQELQVWLKRIKEAGKGNKYDCILGISGGVDSTYLAYKAKEFGLRPLLVHFDNGWNSELAVKNIENIVTKLGFDLHTFVIDWDEFRSLQLAFLRASVIDVELPTDHAMLATLYNLALQHKVKYILSGHNIVSELVLPENWYFNKRDHVHIQAINDQFGEVPLKTFPLLTSKLKFLTAFHEIQSVALLNYLPYNKEEVKKVIIDKLEWRDYGGKHYESIFTRFYQGYILIKKFGVDKRKAHLSNLICSRQITKEQAIALLEKPAYDPQVFATDYEFVLKKFKLTKAEFEEIMGRPVKKHTDYPVDVSIYDRYVILKLVRPFWIGFKKLRLKLRPTKG